MASRVSLKNVMAPQPCLIRPMRAAACQTPPLRAQPISSVEKRGPIHLPEHVPRHCSYQTLTKYCTVPKAEWGSNRDEIVEKSHQCALPLVLSTTDGGMGCSTFILKRVGQRSFPRSVPQLRHRHTLTGATPTPVEAFRVKAQIRCLGGTAAPRTGSSKLSTFCGRCVPGMTNGLSPTRSWSPWPCRARGTLFRVQRPHNVALRLA